MAALSATADSIEYRWIMVKKFRDYIEAVEGSRAEDCWVYFHGHDEDVIGSFILSQLLTEAKKLDLGKGRYVYKHSAHTNPGQPHLHFYQNGAQLYALNKDGSAHDQSHGKHMARWAIDAVKNEFPGFSVPPKGLIEALMMGPVQILYEDVGDQPAVTADVLRRAETS